MSVKKTALIVEDDEIFRRVIRSLLESREFNVREAENGLVGKTIMDLTPFDLIISDVRMPVMDGLSLLQHVKKTAKSKVILITGFSEIVEAQKAFEMGVDEFLPKPFQRHELIKALENCFPLGPSRNRDYDEYCQILITDFISGSALPADIYLKLTDDRFIKLASQGQNVPSDRIQLYRSKGINHLYMKKKDFAQYVGFNLQLLSAVNTVNADLDLTRKRGLVRHVTDTLIEQLYREGLNRERLENASTMVFNSIDILLSNADTSRLMDTLLSAAEAPDHCMAVAMLSCMISEEVGWRAQTTLFKVTLSGLFHDVGDKEVPGDVLRKPRLQLAAHERQLFESHTVRGRDILALVPGLPEDVSIVAAQHHESINGSGYPYGLRGEQIHPLARLVACANTFCEMVLQNPDQTPLTAVKALERLKTHHQRDLDPFFLKALDRILKKSDGKTVGIA